MTREDANKRILLACKRTWNEKTCEEIFKALEQEPTDENLHREREQAYMQGYEDASKRFRQEPSGDLINRQDAIKAIDEKAKRIKNEDTLNGLAGAVGILFDLPPVNPQEPRYCDRNICLRNEYSNIGCDECEVTKSQEPCNDAISRQGDDRWLLHFGQNMAIPSAEPQTEQFAKWVATEIFDDMWEYNKDSFAEIACRKLEKLGIVRAKGDEWELVEPQEGE